MSRRVERSDERVDAQTEWGERFGYSRAVRRGRVIEVAGTTGLLAGQPITAEAYGQARRALELILAAVEALGGSREDVVRTRIFVVDIRRNSEAVGRAHGEAFGDVRPATGIYGVQALLSPTLLVEIEATAIVADRLGPGPAG